MMISLLTSLLVVGVSASSPGVEFVGVGYNLLTANPDGGDSTLGGVDPGLLYTRKVFNIAPGNNPPEVVVEKRHSCVHIQENHVFYGSKSYQDKLGLDVKSSGGVNAAVAKFAFSLSGRYQHAREETNQKHEVFLDNQNVCNLGRARYADELVQSLGFSVSRNFAAAGCRLPSVYNETKYMSFIDQWGTHVTMEVELGSKQIKRYKSTLSQFVEHVRKQGGADISLGGSYMGYGASLAVNFEKFKGSDSYKLQFGDFQYTLEAGTPELPEPIGVKIVTIDTAFNSKYWQKMDDFMSGHQCGDGLDTMALSRRQANVAKALQGYAAYKMAQGPTDPQLIIPVTWPQGTYGLMKAKTGCPGGRVTWHEGWRYEDFEDVMTHNHVSGQLHLAGSFGNNIRFDFCMKGDVKSTEFDMMWPAGDYCVMKYGTCPSDFQEGWIYWNDERHNNKNMAGGALPDGVYNDNTRIAYCCRDDGLPIHEIALPSSKPFFLLKYNRGCQRVTGMSLTEEYVQTDTEDIWGDDSLGGSHPYIDGGKNPRMHYCYYAPKAKVSLIG
ncbi:uncharacterized protein [Haliotis cracherodii]|uniref:uncharacterized protein n=1 Tax=Haliotis cracherodii TaxID=6455 RepID=UPI0039EB2F2A